MTALQMHVGGVKMNRRQRIRIWLAVLILGGIQSTLWAQPSGLSKTVLSPVYTIDKKYKSMEGPQSTQQVYLSDSKVPELLWITGFRTEMVGEDGSKPVLPELMCHVNLDYNVGDHRSFFNWSKNVTSRMLTLSQGQLESQFPEGFGLPILSSEALSLTTQVLNFNLDHPDLKVRHKVTIAYLRDGDLKKSLKPLFNTSAFGMTLIEGHDGHFGMPEGDMADHGHGSLPGTNAPNAVGGSTYDDAMGRKFSGHWIVKPGREENHTNVTKFMSLPFDTDIHYIAAHLHPFAESLELRDLTTGKSLFRSRTKGVKKKIGLARADSYVSKKGIPVFKNHEYEVVSVYNNTTPVNQDSMAVLLLFLLDKEFKKPDLSVSPASVALVPNLAQPSLQAAPQQGVHQVGQVPNLAGPSPADKNVRAILHTNVGDLVLAFFPDEAPNTVAQILRLIRSGAYDTTYFYRVEPGFIAQISNVYGRALPLTPEQRALIQKIPLEASSLKHQRGILSLARGEDPNSGESSFFIMLGDAPHLDGKYAVFGKVLSGLDVLQKIESPSIDANHQPLQRLEIVKAEVLP